jgi:hypothetical protein
MAKKSVFGGILVTLLVFGLVLTGCSTFPSANLKPSAVSYDILGYVGADFGTYDEAFTAARIAYPSADGVIVVKAKADDNVLPALLAQPIHMGYFAVKLKQSEIAPREKFLGIF